MAKAMEYNTQCDRLRLPEYGRNVQQMVDQLLTIEDRAKRSEQAKVVVGIMLRLIPKMRELEDYERKLWDHLHVMSDYRLDVDCPYPSPSQDEIQKTPELIPYSAHNGRPSHYGALVRDVIEQVVAMAPGEARYHAAVAVANQMKRLYLRWNKNTVEDADILADLSRFSRGVLTLPPDTVLAKSETLQGGDGKPKQSNRQPNGGGGNRKRKNRKKR